MTRSIFSQKQKLFLSLFSQNTSFYQNPRSRDFMDLYMICQKYHYKVTDLLAKAKIKFDWHIDPIQLGVRFMQVKELKDYPQLLEKIDQPAVWNFFEKEAKKLKTSILK